MGAMGLMPAAKDSLGLEAAGIVTEIGSAVDNIQVGDRVCLVGSAMFETQKTVAARKVYKIAENLSLEEAVTMPVVYATVIYAVVTLGQLQRGQVGPCGSFPRQITSK